MEKILDVSQTWLECMSCGRKVDLLEERKFRCSECGGLYDVKHNFALMKEAVAISLKELRPEFKTRAKSFNAYEQYDDPQKWSGVWRYKELIMPYLPKRFIQTLGEGNVPIAKAGKNLQKWIGEDINLWIIFEGMTPTGSFKDFGMTVLMSVAKAAGVEIVSCASTGDTSASAAAYAAAAGMKCVVILPRGKVTAVQLSQPLVHGAKVITLPGSFDDCMKVQLELTEKYGVYPANSLNPARIEGHQATVFQLAHFFGWELPSWIVVPVGNGSNCSSIGKAIRLLDELELLEVNETSRILGCQTTAANPLVESWNKLFSQDAGIGYYSDNMYPDKSEVIKKWNDIYHPVNVGETIATAARIGDPVSRRKVIREIISSNGAMISSEESQLSQAVCVCGKDGFNICPQTAIALVGVKNALRAGYIKKDESVVVVSTATGLKFPDAAAKSLEKEIIEVKSCATEEVVKILGI